MHFVLLVQHSSPHVSLSTRKVIRIPHPNLHLNLFINQDPTNPWDEMQMVDIQNKLTQQKNQVTHCSVWRPRGLGGRPSVPGKRPRWCIRHHPAQDAFYSSPQRHGVLTPASLSTTSVRCLEAVTLSFGPQVRPKERRSLSRTHRTGLTTEAIISA